MSTSDWTESNVRSLEPFETRRLSRKFLLTTFFIDEQFFDINLK
jgi:hypothetical protein